MASSTTDTHHTEVGVAHEKAPFPPFQSETFPSQLLWLAITFGLFYYLMAKVALPRISSILEIRSDRIEQDLDEANRMQGESDAAIAAYEQAAAEARANAQDIRQQATEAAKAESATRRAAEEAKLADLIANSEAEIAATKSSAMEAVDGIATETAEALVKTLVGGDVSQAEIKTALSRVGA